MRITHPAGRALQPAGACPGVDEGAPHGSRPPGRAPWRASDPFLACATVPASPASTGTRPAADAACGSRAHSSALRPFPWHAPSLGPAEAARGKRASRPGSGAGFLPPTPRWRAVRWRARSPRASPPLSPVRVPRPARSFPAACRSHLAVRPLRVPWPSAPLPCWAGTGTDTRLEIQPVFLCPTVCGVARCRVRSMAGVDIVFTEPTHCHRSP
jgi:hypothetical protein